MLLVKIEKYVINIKFIYKYLYIKFVFIFICKYKFNILYLKCIFIKL